MVREPLIYSEVPVAQGCATRESMVQTIDSREQSENRTFRFAR